MLYYKLDDDRILLTRENGEPWPLTPEDWEILVAILAIDELRSISDIRFEDTHIEGGRCVVSFSVMVEA